MKMAKKENPYLKLLKAEKCCGKRMKMNSFYSQGTETNTAFCKVCGSYVTVETGEMDEEELDDL